FTEEVLQHPPALHCDGALPRIDGGCDEHEVRDEIRMPRREFGDDLGTHRVADRHDWRLTLLDEKGRHEVGHAGNREGPLGSRRIAEAGEVYRGDGAALR